MSALFAELGYAETPMGPLSLRRRREPTRQVDVFEVKLGDEYLMSSLFTVAEVALARLGLGELDGDAWSVVVGGLGLGYTASAVLDDDHVAELVVIETLTPIIDWHRAGLLPESSTLNDDDRCRFVHADFFALARDEHGFDEHQPGRRVDAVLLDIDHTPSHVLHTSHGDFYTEAGLRRLAGHLHDDGVFGLWSDDPPDDAFVRVLQRAFRNVRAEVVEFPNFLTGGTSSNTVYVATGPNRAG